MAKKDTLSVRIAMEGGDDVRSTLQKIGYDGQRAFDALKGALNDFRTATGGIPNALALIRERLGYVAEDARHVASNFSFLRGEISRLVGVIAAAFSARALLDAVSEWGTLTKTIERVVPAGQKAADVIKRITDLANQSGQRIADTADAYTEVVTALTALGVGGKESTRVFEGLTLALANSNASATESRAVTTALVAALRTGKLEGANFQRVLRDGGVVVQLLAKELGVGVDSLGRMAEQGRITGRVIREALGGNLEQLRRQSDETALTVEKGVNLIHNAFLLWVSSTNEANGLATKLAGIMKWVADNFDLVARASLFVLGGFAAIKGLKLAVDIAQLARSMASLIIPLAEVTVLLLANPFGLAAAGILLLVTGILYATGNLDKFVSVVKATVSDLLGFGTSATEAGAAATDALNAAQAAASGIAPKVNEAAGSTKGLGKSAQDLGKTAGSAAKDVKELGDEGSKAGKVITEQMQGAKPSITEVGKEVDTATQSFLQMAAAAREAAKAVKDIGTGDGGGPTGQPPQQNAAGGMIRGPGTGTSDSILSYLSNGEYVVRARAVRRYGAGLLNMINSMRLPKNAFAGGGLVHAPSMADLDGRLGVRRMATGGMVRIRDQSLQKTGTSGRPLSLTIDGTTFDGLTAPEDVATRLAQYATQRHLRRAGKMPSWYKG